MILSKGLKNEVEIAVVNEPSVFEPLMVCCICLFSYTGDNPIAIARGLLTRTGGQSVVKYDISKLEAGNKAK